MNALPFEIQQIIYDFDGRYKTAMTKCLKHIRNRCFTPIAAKNAESLKCRVRIPTYYRELDRRAKFYLKGLQPDGTIKQWGGRVLSPNKGNKYLFRDALGVYEISSERKTITVNGELYISAKEYPTISVEKELFLFQNRGIARGTVPAPYELDILNPELYKKLRLRKNPVKAFESYGLSQIGIPYVKPYRPRRGPDGKYICKQLEGDKLIHCAYCDLIVRVLSTPSGVYKVLLSSFTWSLVAFVDDKIHWLCERSFIYHDVKIEML